MTCPVCQKDTSADYRPFCSKRCADIDLHRWLGGQYAIGDEGGIIHTTDDHIEEENTKVEYRFDD